MDWVCHREVALEAVSSRKARNFFWKCQVEVDEVEVEVEVDEVDEVKVEVEGFTINKNNTLV